MITLICFVGAVISAFATLALIGKTASLFTYVCLCMFAFGVVIS